MQNPPPLRAPLQNPLGSRNNKQAPPTPGYRTRMRAVCGRSGTGGFSLPWPLTGHIGAWRVTEASQPPERHHHENKEGDAPWHVGIPSDPCSWCGAPCGSSFDSSYGRNNCSCKQHQAAAAYPTQRETRPFESLDRDRTKPSQ